MRLSNKIALVTGGTRGIGRAITQTLAREGARVYFTYLKEVEKATQLVEELTSEGLQVSSIQMDTRSRQSVSEAKKVFKSTESCLHILVNNAGVNKPTDFDQISDGDWDEVLNVNLRGPFICTQEFLDPLRKAQGASVINIGSVSGQYGGPRTAHYAASKAGLISLSQVIARFGAADQIRCNTLAAGLIESEMAQQGLQNKAVQAAAETILLKRFGTLGEVAEVVVFLASDMSSYITAQTINVNGGLYF